MFRATTATVVRSKTMNDNSYWKGREGVFDYDDYDRRQQ